MTPILAGSQEDVTLDLTHIWTISGLVYINNQVAKLSLTRYLSIPIKVSISGSVTFVGASGSGATQTVNVTKQIIALTDKTTVITLGQVGAVMAKVKENNLNFEVSISFD